MPIIVRKETGNNQSIFASDLVGITLIVRWGVLGGEKMRNRLWGGGWGWFEIFRFSFSIFHRFRHTSHLHRSFILSWIDTICTHKKSIREIQLNIHNEWWCLSAGVGRWCRMCISIDALVLALKRDDQSGLQCLFNLYILGKIVPMYVTFKIFFGLSPFAFVVFVFFLSILLSKVVSSCPGELRIT